MNTELIYFLLCGRFANSNIASDDENRFKWELFSRMFQYGPAWAQKLEIQKEIRAIDLNSFREGKQSINNYAANPATAPSTRDTEELPYVNNQNVSKSKRSIADAAALKLSLLDDTITDKFLDHFNNLFIKIVEPIRQQYFITYTNEDVEDNLYNYNGATLTEGYDTRYFTQIFPDYETFLAEWNETPFATQI